MSKLSRVIFAAAIAVGMVFNSLGEILMYDGFPYGDGAYKSNGGTSNINKSNQPSTQFTTDLIFGFDPNQWVESTSVIYSYSNPSKGLALPESFASLPSAQYVGAGSAGGSGNGTNDERSQSKKLSQSVQSSLCAANEFHFRVLMKINQASLNNLQNDSADLNVPNLSAYGAGLTSASGDGTFRNKSGSVSRILCFALRRAAKDDYRLSLLVKGSDETLGVAKVHVYDLVAEASGVKTYLCYARVVVKPDGKEQIYAFAQDVANYDPAVELPLIAEAELVDATTSLSYITVDLARYSAEFIVDEYALATTAEDIMVVGKVGEATVADAALSTASGVMTVSGTVIKANATNAGALLDDGAEVVKFSAGAAAKDVAFEKTVALSELPGDKTYDVNAYAENDIGLSQSHVGYAYSGVLAVEKLQDASEYKLVPGKVQVTRANADPYPLTVNYKFTADKGTPDVTWVDPEGVVTIPAGETSAQVTLQPLQDKSITEDVTLTFSILDGAYLPVAQTVDVKLANLAYPEGYNIWIAEENGLASDAANWSEGRVPASEDAILIDGEFSTADMTWDAGVNNLPSVVKSWTMRNGVVAVAGTVTIPTAYSGDFTCLTVNGDMEISGGQLTQSENGIESETYRLRIDVKGDLTVGENGLIDVTAKGPKGSSADGVVKVHPTGVYGSYGGDAGTFGKTYGDPKRPYECGNGHSYVKANIAGGGAVWIEVAGVANINGRILSNNETWNSSGVKQTTGGSGRSSSGGAVYLEASEVKGAGTISVAATSNGGEGGSGGRLAIWSKTKACSISPYNLKAYGIASNSNVGSAGTVVVRNPGEENGTLYVRNMSSRPFTAANRAPMQNQTTTIPAGQTWTFDALVFGDYGILTLGEGVTLNLPNGFASVSSLTTAADVNSAPKRRQTGLVYRGGMLNVPAVAGVHTFSGDWTFHPAVPFVLTADETIVTEGANFGMMSMCRSTSTLDKFYLKVVGDLTVSETGTLNVEDSGLGGDPDCGSSNFLDWPTGSSIWGMGHGGQNGQFLDNVSCGSFFSPELVGVAGGKVTDRNIGGGALMLEVTGCLTHNGSASASSAFPLQNTNGSWGTRPASPGSISITAGSLVGVGSITADGAIGLLKMDDNGYGPSGGGRVSVRLTDDGADFSQFDMSKITAKGATNTGASYVNNPTNQASAGSVYLQTAAEGEKCGTIVIRNDGFASNLAYTPIPASAYADAVADFEKASLSLLDCGKVRLYETLTMAKLMMAADTKLDLNGNKLTVNAATLGDAKLEPGAYAASDRSDYLADSVGGGSLVVVGAAKRGTVIIYR